VTRIEVFADVVCPFTHVGLRRLDEARRARGVSLPMRVRAWPLEVINGHPLDPDHAAREIEGLKASVAPELFKGFDAARFPQTSIPAFGLVAAAYATSESAGVAVGLAVRAALFEDGVDISDVGVLRMIGQRFGVRPLTGEAAEAAVSADWARGRERGVLGSPHFFVDDESWFCPSLAIRHEGGEFVVAIDRDRMEAFYDAAFGDRTPSHQTAMQ
jgi:predicted DsbA family dithiol-disulfide isomerase